jgi:hypothetical protein
MTEDVSSEAFKAPQLSLQVLLVAQFAVFEHRLYHKRKLATLDVS